MFAVEIEIGDALVGVIVASLVLVEFADVVAAEIGTVDIDVGLVVSLVESAVVEGIVVELLDGPLVVRV